MKRQQKKFQKIIVQKNKTNLVNFRILLYRKGKLEVINIYDGTETYREEAWIESKQTFTKRTKQIYKQMTKNECFCNMTERYHEQYDQKHLEDKINSLVTNKNEGYLFSDMEYSEWLKYVQIPLTQKNYESHGKGYKAEIAEIPF